jgi:predicted nucleotidyltransferase
VKIDLEAGQLQEVRRILAQMVPGIPVWAFGSRVTGKAKKFSDLDIALASDRPTPKDKLWDLRDSFSESDLPFRVDVIDLASVSPEFKSAVMARHVALQGH